MVVPFSDSSIDAFYCDFSSKRLKVIVGIDFKTAFVFPECTPDIGDDHVFDGKTDFRMIGVKAIYICNGLTTLEKNEV